ncbi:MAG: hypothetical protein ABEI52_11595 [Halobacteriaceae archaeon]
MPPRERGEGGQFVETVPMKEVLSVFDRIRGPVITSSDVADALNCTTEAARQKLSRLYDQGTVDKRKTGRVVVYWRTSEHTPQERNDAQAPAQETRGEDADANDSDPESKTHPTDESDFLLELLDHIEEVADDVLPGSGSTLDKRHDALQGVVEYLLQETEVKRAEFQKYVYPIYQAGYTNGENPENSWWKNCILPGLRELAERSDVIEKAGPSGEWRYTGSFEYDE